MKKKLIISLIVVIVAWYLLAVSTSAKADGLRIQSPKGITQAQWIATPEYQSFNCPDGYGRGEGVDMNFTADKSDDYWFAYCIKFEIIKPIVSIPQSESPKPVVEQPKIDTSTAITTIPSSPVTNSQPQQNNNYVPQPTIQETTTSVLEIQTVVVKVEPLVIPSTTLMAKAINGQVVVEKRTTRPIYRWRYLREYSE